MKADLWSVLRTAIVAQFTGSNAILRVTMTWTIHYSACCSLPAAHNNHSITTCKQLVTAFHQWQNNDVFTFPKRIMPECQPSGCINKSREGVSKGKKIFKITNATKFPTKRELAITWLHYIGTGHSVDLLNLIGKSFVKITLQNSRPIAKRIETFIAIWSGCLNKSFDRATLPGARQTCSAIA